MPGPPFDEWKRDLILKQKLKILKRGFLYLAENIKNTNSFLTVTIYNILESF